ncbi:hypothetical protein [Ralstonia phage RP31]|uniref:AAA+ ATPase domain-containing protein n=2 Tax=Ripduovirus RP12 TaxID=2560700 RepID=A0A1L7N125_9CAUD|nr:hypothetical protein FDH28_gp215 [Ralstonia phage RP12]BAW19180.1 hypothetical protein [Ralstonia phage RP12]BAW19466.1 hypothetical protein [Ralstonia phage RP31]
MKESTLHAVDTKTSKSALDHIADLLPASPAVVKTLDSKFESFGDALFSWMNSDGFENKDSKNTDSGMVRAFNVANGLPHASGSTKNLLNNEHYFESDAWFFQYVEEKGFIRLGRGLFILLDDYNRPLMLLDIDGSHSSNIAIDFCGVEHLVLEFREVIKANIKTDELVEKKSTYAEVVKGGSHGMLSIMSGGDGLRCVTGKIDNKRIALPEYYPYLDGGVEALLKDFIESEETVLILMGPPGTGKSSAVSAAVDALNLLPIYAKKADAILDKDFVNFVFKCSDEYMAKVAGTSAKARSDLFTESLIQDKEFLAGQPLFEKKKKKNEEEEEVRVPIIVVEDADQLLAPRSQGNLIMPELLNETDGIGSNHTRKIIFTTNLSKTTDIDSALMRPGRCYDVVNCRLLTPTEAIAARAANGLPEFETVPVKDVSLAEALRKPRKRICVSNGGAVLGFKG